ncbi:hypothetical protein ACULNC_17745 [Shigella flexneri]
MREVTRRATMWAICAEEVLRNKTWRFMLVEMAECRRGKSRCDDEHMQALGFKAQQGSWEKR